MTLTDKFIDMDENEAIDHYMFDDVEWESDTCEDLADIGSSMINVNDDWESF